MEKTKSLTCLFKRHRSNIECTRTAILIIRLTKSKVCFGRRLGTNRILGRLSFIGSRFGDRKTMTKQMVFLVLWQLFTTAHALTSAPLLCDGIKKGLLFRYSTALLRSCTSTQSFPASLPPKWIFPPHDKNRKQGGHHPTRSQKTSVVDHHHHPRQFATRVVSNYSEEQRLAIVNTVDTEVAKLEMLKFYLAYRFAATAARMRNTVSNSKLGPLDSWLSDPQQIHEVFRFLGRELHTKTTSSSSCGTRTRLYKFNSTLFSASEDVDLQTVCVGLLNSVVFFQILRRRVTMNISIEKPLMIFFSRYYASDWNCMTPARTWAHTSTTGVRSPAPTRLVSTRRG